MCERYIIKDRWIVDTKLNKNIHSIDCYEEKSILDIMKGQDQRISELEEELENYKLCRCVDCSTEYEKGLETSIDELENENQQLKQSQKQLAIEELKLALENFRNRPTHFDVARQELCLSDQDKQFIDFINNRIKELDGGKNDHK